MKEEDDYDIEGLPEDNDDLYSQDTYKNEKSNLENNNSHGCTITFIIVIIMLILWCFNTKGCQDYNDKVKDYHYEYGN